MAKHILYIEDDQVLLDILMRFLKHAGFEVSMARDGEEALEMLKTIAPDLILLDLLLPRMHGFEVLKRLKADPKTASIPVVVLSNLGGEEDKNTGRALGAAEYLVKASFIPEEIVAHIDNVLERTQHSL